MPVGDAFSDSNYQNTPSATHYRRSRVRRLHAQRPADLDANDRRRGGRRTGRCREGVRNTEGDFRAKFTAAVEARMAKLASPEAFIELPDDPDQLRKADLERLVRPAAHGFLRSNPNKDELLDQVARIRRRQDRRPAWIPRIDRDGNPIPTEQNSHDDIESEPDRQLVIAALPELGEVTVQLPKSWDDRPELPMAPGGIGEWESALFALLGVAGEDSPASTIAINAKGNESLVPNEVRGWPTESTQSASAAEDPGVASELLATSPVLGGLPVVDDGPEARDVIADALMSAGDWRYGPRWLLETWAAGDDIATMSVARAAIAGWADEDCSGLLVYVYGGALHRREGLLGTPVPLHSYLLAVTRSPEGTDTIDAVHRIAWSCPGELWCHRGGCPEVDFFEAAALLAPIVAAGHAAAATEGDWAESHRLLYGDGDGPDYPDNVLEHLAIVLSAVGWVELMESAWEGGIEELLLRRGEHCLAASHDPVMRQIMLIDGKNELEWSLEMLADDGVLTDGKLDIDAAGERWDTELLAAADDLLHGRITKMPRLASPVQVTVVGLHPHADGTLRGPFSADLAQLQLRSLAATVDLLTSPEQPAHEDELNDDCGAS
ncbi:hypothetical protein [Lentzea pudingi]|nr:hypothetical protein [Lentzea pudingi]